MSIVVLLSASRHPVSGRPGLSRLEAQAIGLGLALAEATGVPALGLHAGPDTLAVGDAFGHGVARLLHRLVPGGHDPTPALADALSELRPNLVLAGRRGQGGADTGLVPYRLAERLGLPLVADVVAVEVPESAGAVRFEQPLPRGARRRVTLRLPALATVHPLSPPPPPFVFARARRGRAETRPGLIGEANPPGDTRAYRQRPKLMPKAAATSAGQAVHDHPDPSVAARLILDHLEELGIRRYRIPPGSAGATHR